MRTITVPADKDCPFPVVVVFRDEPNSGTDVCVATGHVGDLAVCRFEERSQRDLKQVVDLIRRHLVASVFQAKHREFHDLARELERLISPPLGGFTDTLQCHEILNKMHDLMRYAPKEVK